MHFTDLHADKQSKKTRVKALIHENTPYLLIHIGKSWTYTIKFKQKKNFDFKNYMLIIKTSSNSGLINGDLCFKSVSESDVEMHYHLVSGRFIIKEYRHY